jgi:hypothetical protein
MAADMFVFDRPLFAGRRLKAQSCAAMAHGRAETAKLLFRITYD